MLHFYLLGPFSTAASRHTFVFSSRRLIQIHIFPLSVETRLEAVSQTEHLKVGPAPIPEGG